jgi:hypothetical protein
VAPRLARMTEPSRRQHAFPMVPRLVIGLALGFRSALRVEHAPASQGTGTGAQAKSARSIRAFGAYPGCHPSEAKERALHHSTAARRVFVRALPARSILRCACQRNFFVASDGV